MKKLAVVFFFLVISSSAFAQETARERLFEAIEAGDKDTVLKMVSKRRHVNLNHRETWDGETFLIEAIRANQLEIVRILLTHGADPNLREIEGVDAEDKNLPGATPLAAALEADSTEMVQLLMKPGVKLRDNPSVLHQAASIEMIRFLIDRGAPIDGRNDDGATYLQTVAADAGDDAEQEEVARLLIERGANVNIADKDGGTPLLRCQSIEIAQLLIAHGANVNATDRKGMTPLHMAAFEESRIELGKLLVTSMDSGVGTYRTLRSFASSRLCERIDLKEWVVHAKTQSRKATQSGNQVTTGSSAVSYRKSISIT